MTTCGSCPARSTGRPPGRRYGCRWRTAEKLTNDARVETYREREKATKIQQLASAHREQLATHLNEMLARVEAIPDGSRAE